MTAVAETVVNNFVALDNQSTNIVPAETAYQVIVSDFSGLTVSVNLPGNIIQQSETFGSVLAGPAIYLGSTEMASYTTRIDFVSETVLYKGEAVPGTPEATTAWRISKTVIASDDDVTTTWASGTAAFDKAWSNRLSYSYT